jgi:hypothetical protein
VAAAISVFCLTSTKVLLTNGAYKRHVINANHKAADQLRQNLDQSKTLLNQYQVFEGDNPKNIIGGKNTTDTKAVPPDGNNSRIVLNALPSSYDFPALISSMAKILNDNRLNNPGIGGSDQSGSTESAANVTAEPVAIPLTVNGTGGYDIIQALIRDLERSIRPFDLTNLQVQGSSSSMTITASLNTYYQPPKSLNITSEDVK